MKKVRYILILLYAIKSYAINAQCNQSIIKPKLAKNMFLWGYFSEDDSKLYVAEIMNGGNRFVARFLHSDSKYTMQFNSCGESTIDSEFCNAKVASSSGGKFKAGDTFNFKIFESVTECPIATSTTVIVKFQDGKTFFGEMALTDSDYQITFQHSMNVYTIDKETLKIVGKTAGDYKIGSKVSITHAQLILIE